MLNLQSAINGNQIQIVFQDLYDEQLIAPPFFSIAELNNWCITFNLSYNYNPTTNIYTIIKNIS